MVMALLFVLANFYQSTPTLGIGLEVTASAMVHDSAKSEDGAA